MKSELVLDASALLALIQDEKGADVVKPLLSKSAISAVNIAEVLTTLKKVDILPKESLAFIEDIIQVIVPFDSEQAQHVAELHPHVKSKGLSLGDRACLALGLIYKLPVYTADRIWKEIQIDIPIELIR